MDYFWVFAAISASFGAVLTGMVLRKLDISRMSYREARQLLSAIVASLSTRIQRNEVAVKEISEQVQMLTAKQARPVADVGTSDKERLLGYMQEWIGNVRRFVDKVETLQKNLKRVQEEFEELRVHVDRMTRSQQIGQGVDSAPVGVVTEHTLEKLTPTERKVLEMLVSGPRAAPEIGRLMTKSREHTARLMKSLFEQGFVERETERQPYEYRLSEKVREAIVQAIQR